jgi:two-component system, response regulator
VPPSSHKRAIAVPPGEPSYAIAPSARSGGSARGMPLHAGTITVTRPQTSATDLQQELEGRGICVNERKILIVEDNPTDAALLVRALEQAGIKNPLVIAKDGLEAIQYLFAFGRYEFRDPDDVPAIVLIDLNLPKIDGLEVLRRMRSDYRTKLIPVTIFTSSIEEQDLINGYSLGANSYVRKPIEFSRFSQVVALLVTYWTALNEPPPSGEKTWAHHFGRTA